MCFVSLLVGSAIRNYTALRIPTTIPNSFFSLSIISTTTDDKGKDHNYTSSAYTHFHRTEIINLFVLLCIFAKECLFACSHSLLSVLALSIFFHHSIRAASLHGSLVLTASPFFSCHTTLCEYHKPKNFGRSKFALCVATSMEFRPRASVLPYFIFAFR